MQGLIYLLGTFLAVQIDPVLGSVVLPLCGLLMAGLTRLWMSSHLSKAHGSTLKILGGAKANSSATHSALSIPRNEVMKKRRQIASPTTEFFLN